ncbi:MAG: zinc ribbon domain-containing protein [Nanoarchaeota archaeon]
MGSNVDLRDQVKNQAVLDTLGEVLSGKKGYKIVQETTIRPCRNCRKPVKSNDKFCPECGTKIQEEIKKNCPNCKKELKGIGKFCTECGAKI